MLPLQRLDAGLITGKEQLLRSEAPIACRPRLMLTIEAATHLTGCDGRRTILHDGIREPGHERAPSISNSRECHPTKEHIQFQKSNPAMETPGYDSGCAARHRRFVPRDGRTRDDLYCAATRRALHGSAL